MKEGKLWVLMTPKVWLEDYRLHWSEKNPMDSSKLWFQNESKRGLYLSWRARWNCGERHPFTAKTQKKPWRDYPKMVGTYPRYYATHGPHWVEATVSACHWLPTVARFPNERLVSNWKVLEFSRQSLELKKTIMFPRSKHSEWTNWRFSFYLTLGMKKDLLRRCLR